MEGKPQVGLWREHRCSGSEEQTKTAPAQAPSTQRLVSQQPHFLTMDTKRVKREDGSAFC